MLFNKLRSVVFVAITQVLVSKVIREILMKKVVDLREEIVTLLGLLCI